VNSLGQIKVLIVKSTLVKIIKQVLILSVKMMMNYSPKLLVGPRQLNRLKLILLLLIMSNMKQIITSANQIN